jgi:cytosine/adenosine deaminase-related metal-dependent hydrolase
MGKVLRWLSLTPLCAALLTAGSSPAFTTGHDYLEAPAELLGLATLGSAKIAGRAERLGTLEVGKLADLILVDGDLLTDMSDIRNVVLAIKDGTIYHPAEMYQAIGVTP